MCFSKDGKHFENGKQRYNNHIISLLESSSNANPIWLEIVSFSNFFCVLWTRPYCFLCCFMSGWIESVFFSQTWIIIIIVHVSNYWPRSLFFPLLGVNLGQNELKKPASVDISIMLVYGRASGQPEPAKWHQGGITRFLHYKKMVFLLPCNKSLIEQACSIKMTRYWPLSLLLLFNDKSGLHLGPLKTRKQLWHISKLQQPNLENCLKHMRMFLILFYFIVLRISSNNKGWKVRKRKIYRFWKQWCKADTT